MTWSIGRKLGGAFAGVSLLFVLALGVGFLYSNQADRRWNETTRLSRAADGSAQQLAGIRAQMTAQAMLTATFDKRYEQAFAAGVTTGNKGTAAVEALHDPVVASISSQANEADHRHDATVNEQLFPAVRRGDRAAAVAALGRAYDAVSVVLEKAGSVGAHIERRHAAAVSAAHAAARKARLFGALASLAALGLALIISIAIVRGIRRGVAGILDRLGALEVDCEALAQGLDATATGDLTQTVEASATAIEQPGSDEIGQVAVAVNAIRDSTAASIGAYDRMRLGLQSMIADVSGAAASVSQSSQGMATSSGETGRAVDEIAGAVGEVAEGIERQARALESARELTDRVAQASASSASTAGEAAEAARTAHTVAAEGAAAVEAATAAMEAVRASSSEATESIRELGERSQEITDIVGTISAIAEQTNLLALNAAIEAARAGEQGRGFAVVAEEVRQLAENAQAAAGDIATLVRDVQSKTEQAVAVVEEGARRTTEGSSTVGTAHDAFRRLGGSVEDMSARVEEIATALGEIADAAGQMQVSVSDVAAVAEESSASMQQVSAATEQTAASSREISDAAGGMAETAESLEALVGRFRLVP